MTKKYNRAARGSKNTKKKPSPLPDLTEEVRLGFFISGAQGLLIGVDEVGRGCLAGPVVAAAAVLDASRVSEFPVDEMGQRILSGARAMQFEAGKHGLILKVRDSKLVPEDERPVLVNAVKEFVLEHAIGVASIEEIEKLNILYASHLAMERAVHSLEEKIGRKADRILVDGHIVPRVFFGRGVPLIKGDQKSLTVACASLIAKVYRDEMMAELDSKYPGYGFKEHKGYGTPAHRKKIVELGVTGIHRKTFAGVKEHL